MFLKFVHVNSFTREDRHLMISRTNDVLSGCGAIIIDFRMYSNRSICILFELPVNSIKTLQKSLPETGLVLFEESIETLAEFASKLEELAVPQDVDIYGTLQITFLHNEPDLRREIPPFEL